MSKAADRVAVALGSAVAPLALTALSMFAGCTATEDPSREKCDTETDCADAFPGLPYTCVENTCERASCESDQGCRVRGGHFATSICDLETRQCAPAECTAVDGCGTGRVCDLATNRCKERECSVTADCLTATRESPTVQCIQGQCVDPQWGCIGQPDDRAHVPGEKGTLEFQLLSAVTDAPIPGAVWDIKVCGSAQYDIKGCDPDFRPPGTNVEVDPKTGTVRVSGLDPELPVRIWIDETSIPDKSGFSSNGRAIMPLEFVTQKPPVGVTKEPPVRVSAWESLRALIASHGNPPVGDITSIVNKTNASIYGMALDCQDHPAANVKPSYKFVNSLGPISDSLMYFFDEAGVAHAAANTLLPVVMGVEWTFPSGSFSTLNLPAVTNINIKTELVVDTQSKRTRTIRELYSSRLTAGRMTTVHLYPRNYAIKYTH